MAQTMAIEWIGAAGKAAIDIWTLVHLSFWIFIGSCIWAVKADRWLSIMICMGLALSWEAFERVAEKQWPRLWLSPESWINAWVTDPLTCLVGMGFIFYALDNWR